jgi:CheY-like chemotaxis protein
MEEKTRSDTSGRTEPQLIILLAEDDDNDVVLIRRCARRLPISNRLIIVPDGGEAIDYVCGNGIYSDRTAYPFPSVLLLDRVMPRVSGLDALFWLRSEPRFKQLPVVVFSSDFSPAQREMVVRLGAVCALKALTFPAMGVEIEQGILWALRAAKQ